MRTFPRKQNASLSDQEPFGRHSLELSEGNSYSAGEALPTSVVTDIEGGLSVDVQTRGSSKSASKEDDSTPQPAILRTVQVEQLYENPR